MEFEAGTDVDGEVLENSTDMEFPVGNDKETGGSSSVGGVNHQGKDDMSIQNSSGKELDVVTGDEPYVGQEFESEAAALAFYSAYGMRVGFITRVSQVTRSRRDRSIIGRAIVCNKEGYRLPDKRGKNLKPRKPTRVGCRAMIYIKKRPGRWIVSRFVKEHTHPLTPGNGRKDVIFNQYPNEHEKIQELTQQLLLERKKSLAYRRHLDLIFKHIEEHEENLSKKVQYIVESVKEIESKEEEC